MGKLGCVGLGTESESQVKVSEFCIVRKEGKRQKNIYLFNEGILYD
jgi:hypothetical protein